MTHTTAAAAKADDTTAEMKEDAIIKSYELMVLINGELREPDAKKEIESIEKWVEKNHGKITVSDYYGKRSLAYPVKKQREGFYAVFNFNLPADRAQAINKMLRLEKEIHRYLILSLPEGYEYINYLNVAKEEQKEAVAPESKVSQVVIEHKPKVEKPMVKKAEAAPEEKKSDKDAKEPVDKDLDAKLDKILGGSLDF